MPGHVGARIDLVHAIMQESRPVVWRNLVQILHQFIEGVGHDERTGVSAFAEKDLLEIIKRFLVLGHLADERVGIQPQQLALKVVVLAASPVGPRRIAPAQNAGGHRRVFRRTPLAAGRVVKIGRRQCEYIAVSAPESSALNARPARCRDTPSCLHRPRAARPACGVAKSG